MGSKNRRAAQPPKDTAPVLNRAHNWVSKSIGKHFGSEFKIKPVPRKTNTTTDLNISNTRAGEMKETVLRLKSGGSPSNNTLRPFVFLELPGEIRNSIYNYLLVNDQLSNVISLSRRGSRPRPQLQLNILRACKLILAEASSVFYELNTFSLSVGEVVEIYGPINFYHGPGELNSAILRVKKWLINIDLTHQLGRHHIAHNLTAICRIFSTLRSLEIKVTVSPNINPSPESRYAYFSCWDPEHENKDIWFLTSGGVYQYVLRPLGLLRNLKSLQFGPGIVPKYLKPEAVSFLRALSSGSTPVVCISELHSKLLAYAQIFERHAPFQSDMDSQHEIFGNEQFNNTIRDGNRLNIYTELQNPYIRSGSIHPTEDALRQAREARDVETLFAFRYYRNKVLNSLEPQYRRIQAARNAFPKLWNRPSHLKSTDPVRDILEALSGKHLEPKFVGQHFNNFELTALILLEQYAAALERDKPLSVQLHIRPFKKQFEALYRDMPREKALRRLDLAMETRSSSGFLRDIGIALGDMEDQYQSICAARRELFAADPDENFGSDIFEADRSFFKSKNDG